MPNMETSKRYRIVADRKAQVAGKEGDAASVQFVIKSNGYKQAWSEARNLTRIGGEKLATEKDGETVDLQAGMFTVRSVFTLDKAQGGGRKSKVVTAQDFIAAAQGKGIHLPKKLTDLASEMGVMPAVENADEGEGSGQSAAA